jgi:hypothetical protein
MKNKLYLKWLSLLLLLIAVNATAQLNVGGTPYSWDHSIANKKEIPKINFPIPDRAVLDVEDRQDEINGIPPRFGFLNNTQINLLTEDNKVGSIDGLNIWQLSIKCPTALSVNLLFDKFWLPDGGKLYMYSVDRKHIIGGFTSVNNKGDLVNLKGFGTGLVYGDDIIIEYQEPQEVNHSAIISISGIVHGYRYINVPNQYNKTDDFGNSGSCEVNVNCSEGVNWQNQKKGIALILVGGSRWCTGSLINNTSNSGDLLFLTANHCLGGWVNSPAKDAVSNPNATDWSFWWNYESPSCTNPSSEPSKTVTNGATVLANNSNSDFALLKLTESPLSATPTVSVYFNGWDKSTTVSSNGVCIHHPAGDVKKISKYSSNLISTTSGSPTAQVWNATWVATTNGFGVTEGGSSGSPLFNSNKLIIGQLFGGPSSCSSSSSDKNDNFGRFSSSWATGGTNTSRLSNWLDPNNTGTSSLEGGYWDGCQNVINVNNPINSFADIQAANYISANSTIANSAIVNMRAGNFIEFTNGFEAKAGSTLIAQIAPCGGRVIPPANKKENEMLIENPSNTTTTLLIYPNPTTGKLNIDFVLTDTDQVFFSITNLLGDVVMSWNKTYSGVGSISEQATLDNLASGVYLIHVSNKNTKFNQKIIIQ